MKKVIITGPTGTIGIALIKELIQHDVEVLAICRVNSKNIGNIPQSNRIKIIECNLDQLTKLKIIGDYDVFYHFGWDGTLGKDRDNLSNQLRNVQYTIDAVDLAARCNCKMFIGAGSQAEYGRHNEVLSPKSLPIPETGYGVAKLTAGHMSRIHCKSHSIRHIWVRVFSIFGPYDDENTLIMSLIRNIKRGEKMSLTSGTQIWDYLYSKDAANAFYLLGNCNLDEKIYCLGSGLGLPLNEYIKQIRDIINPNYQLKFGALEMSKTQTKFLIADITDLEKDIGYNPKVEFSVGIRNILNNENE